MKTRVSLIEVLSVKQTPRHIPDEKRNMEISLFSRK